MFPQLGMNLMSLLELSQSFTVGLFPAGVWPASVLTPLVFKQARAFRFSYFLYI